MNQHKAQGVRTSVIRQNTCFTAVGSVLRGFSVSAAHSPTSSVPAKENAAVTNTEHRPLNPLWKAPGLYLTGQPHPECLEFSLHSPIFGPNVALSMDTSAINDNPKNDESDHGNDFDDGEDKLCLTISFDAEQVDGYNHH